MSMKRKLAVLLSADVAEYSRHVREHEESAVATLRGHRVIVDQLIAQHGGRIANTAGDSVLAEFESPVEAVRCAVEMQEAMRGRNEALPEGRRMWFRVGLNLGDVMVQENGDLLGDGVNVAARTQTLADPGGICISNTVREQVENKVALSFEDLGQQHVKNIPQPVHLYRLRAGPALRTASAVARAGPTRRLLVVLGALLICATGGTVWYLVMPSARSYDGQWFGQYSCEAGVNPGFSVPKLAVVRNGEVEITSGAPRHLGYFDIKGDVSAAGKISLSGHGFGQAAGFAPSRYTIEMMGKIAGDTMTLSGFQNGRRRCTAILKRTSH